MQICYCIGVFEHITINISILIDINEALAGLKKGLHQYLGLLLMEIMFLIEEDYLSEGYITGVEEYLLDHKQKIASDILLETADFFKEM